MDRRDPDRPTVHDALRALGRHVSETGAERVLVSTSADGQWTVLYMQANLSASGAKAPEQAVTFSADDVQRMVTDSRARRGTGGIRGSEGKLNLETVLRAGGEALEEAGRRDFTLLADDTGMVSLGPNPSNAPIRLTATTIEGTERERNRAREMRQAVFHPGQSLLYQPRGAADPVVVVVQRLGTHQITVRLPGQEVLAVHRKWLRALDAPAPLEVSDSSPGKDLAYAEGEDEHQDGPIVSGLRANSKSYFEDASWQAQPSDPSRETAPPQGMEHTATMAVQRDRKNAVDVAPAVPLTPAEATSAEIDHFDAVLNDEAEALRSVAEKLEEARQARAWLFRRHRSQQANREPK